MIELPATPAPVGVKFKQIDFGSTITPPTGGPDQRVNRLGNRWSVEVTMPPMPNLEIGQRFVSRLIRGKSEGVRMALPMLGTSSGDVGTPRLALSPGVGRTIDVKNIIADHEIREGQFFSIETGGRHYVYMSNVDVMTSSAPDPASQATIQVSPLLRIAHAINDGVHFERPFIEGLIYGDADEWEIGLTRNVELVFEIRETR